MGAPKKLPPGLSVAGEALEMMRVHQARLHKWLLLNSSESTPDLQHLARVMQADIELIEERIGGQQMITDN